MPEAFYECCGEGGRKYVPGIGNSSDTKAGWKADRKVCRKADRRVCRKADRKVCRKVSKKDSKQGIRFVVTNMLRKEMPVDMIISVTDMTKEEVEAIRRELEDGQA